MKVGTVGFFGARLRHAREARSMTAASLAELLGITPAAVSQYENNRQTPSPDVMRRISERLNLPIHHFLRPPISIENDGTIFFRSMATATKAARTRAGAHYRWAREIVGFLRRYVVFPDVKFPTLELPDDPKLISNQDIEAAAEQARRFWGLADGPISHVTRLLENNGAIIARFDLHAQTLDAFSQWSTSDNAPYIVLGTSKPSAVRSRLDLAHELGHLLLHQNVDQKALNQNSDFNLIEEQAFRFAGAFLLPARTFASDLAFANLDSLRSLKSKWKVAISAMIMRAANLGIVSEQQERRLWINMARRDWRKREPLDDVLEVEQPCFLQRSIALLIDKKVIDARDLPFRLALPTSDIENLGHLEPGSLTGERNDVVLAPEIRPDPQILRFPHSA